MGVHPPICLWTIYPNAHQRAFFDAVRQAGVDLTVCYFGCYGADRLAQGWDPPATLPASEFHVTTLTAARQQIPDYNARVQITTGFCSRIYWQVAWDVTRRHAPWVLWSEASSRRLRSWLPRRLMGAWVRRYAAGVFAIGDLAARDLRGWGIPTEMMRYLPYATPPRRTDLAPDSILMRFLETSGASGTVFIYVGTLSQWKGTDLLLRAFGNVHAEHPGARLLLVGPDGSGGRLARWLSDSGARAAICVRGAMPPEQIDAAFACAQVAVLPSRRKDGWGMALAEAARNGLALIATDCCGAAGHLVRPGASGCVVAAGDGNALAAALGVYAADPTLSRKQGEAAIRLAAETSSEHCARRLADGLLAFVPR